MKLLFDNNLSVLLPDAVHDYFPGSQHVYHLGIHDWPDQEIWRYAQANGFAIVTKDKDFYHLANTLGHPPKLIWLTMGNCRNSALITLLVNRHKEIAQFMAGAKGILILR